MINCLATATTLKEFAGRTNLRSDPFHVQGDRLAKLERYELLDPECDSPQLEAMLLEAVRGSHTPYSRKELQAVLPRRLLEPPDAIVD